jgi:hypothetical protein
MIKNIKNSKKRKRAEERVGLAVGPEDMEATGLG